MENPEPLSAKLTRLAQAKFGGSHGFRRKLAKASDLPESQVSKVLLGRVEPTLPTLRKLAVGLGLPLLALTDPEFVPAAPLMPARPLPAIQAIPLLGDLGAGRPRHDPAEATDSLQISGLFPDHSVAYRVKGRSMEIDHILDGDYVIAVPSSTADGGAKVVAWVDGQGGYLKRYDAKKKTIFSGNGRNRWTHVMRPEDLIVGVFVGLIRKG